MLFYCLKVKTGPTRCFGFSTLRPVAATASRIAGLTRRSCARSLGVIFSDPRTCLITTSSGMPGMASEARCCCSMKYLITSRCSGPALNGHAHESHRQPLSRAHFSASRCPPSAALLHVDASRGQRCRRAYFSISRCPPAAAAEHVVLSHAALFTRNHFSNSRFPSAAAFAHSLLILSFRTTTSAVMTMVPSSDTKPLSGSYIPARDMALTDPQLSVLLLNVCSWLLMDPLQKDRAFIVASSSSSRLRCGFHCYAVTRKALPAIGQALLIRRVKEQRNELVVIRISLGVHMHLPRKPTDDERLGDNFRYSVLNLPPVKHPTERATHRVHRVRVGGLFVDRGGGVRYGVFFLP